jgi:AcrR family transcriptional regulator
VAATELLLETGQAKSVSIRSVAQRVGVTPPSIYLHFADKDGLMDAVCARYFEKLDLEMQRVAPEHTSAVELLRVQGLAYIRFATENPELYRIATMGEWRSGTNIDVALDNSAFQHICATGASSPRRWGPAAARRCHRRPGLLDRRARGGCHVDRQAAPAVWRCRSVCR